MKFKHNLELSKWSRSIIFLWFISICIVIYYSLIPQVEFPINFWNADKLYHCAAYGWLAVLPIMGFSLRRFALPAALSMILLGVLLEIGQYYIPGRTFSLLDITANSLGVILGIILGNDLRKRLEWVDK
jgi:VanZ family protein